MHRLLLILPLLLACCTAPKATPEIAPQTTARTNTFLPSTHGFRFVNHFEGSPLPAALRDPSSPLGAILGGPAGKNIPATFGLCGGMSLTAADHYLAGVPMPAVTSPPAPGTPLYAHLYQRQVESLGDSGVMALAFWKWMNLPDGMDDTDPAVTPQSAADLTIEELAGINARLRRGEIVPLGLVLVRSRSNTRAPKSRAGQLWNNHQVIAYACTEGTAYGYSLRIYDPNFPDDDNVTIRIDTPTGLTSHGFFRVTGQGRTTRVRGIFPMPYTPSRPFIQPERSGHDPDGGRLIFLISLSISLDFSRAFCTSGSFESSSFAGGASFPPMRSKCHANSAPAPMSATTSTTTLTMLPFDPPPLSPPPLAAPLVDSSND